MTFLGPHNFWVHIHTKCPELDNANRIWGVVRNFNLVANEGKQLPDWRLELPMLSGLDWKLELDMSGWALVED